MTDFMLDIETLGLKPGCQILTIACAPFDIKTKKIGKIFYKKIDMKNYDEYKVFTTDKATIDWWNKQDEKVKYEAFESEPRESLIDVFNSFNSFLLKNCENKDIRMWSHGKEFDIPIVEFVMNILNIKPTWNFWNTRDTRTLYDLAKVNLKNISIPKEYIKQKCFIYDELKIEGLQLNYESFCKHNAVYDIVKQIMGVFESYRLLNLI